jgi:lysophospholipase L1-like esterase
MEDPLPQLPLPSLRPSLRRLSLFVSAALAVTLGLALGGAPSAGASSVNYVALGDSYSAGTGSSHNYLDSCDRSTSAFPYLYSIAAKTSSFHFQACMGATTSSTESSQLGALNSGTDLVSLTDGGNDVGFSTIMEHCVAGTDDYCLDAINKAEDMVRTQLPGRLDTLYSDIRKDAPNAHVVVLGYPEFFDLSGPSDCSPFDATKRAALNRGVDLLDSAIAGEVAKHANFTFEDVRPYFAGHQVCDSDPWLHNVALPDLTSSFHPTAEGHQNAYLPAFTAGTATPLKNVLVYTQKVVRCFSLDYQLPNGSRTSTTFGERGAHGKVSGDGWTGTGILVPVGSTVNFKTYWVDCPTAVSSPNKNWAESGTWHVRPTELKNVWINTVDSMGS